MMAALEDVLECSLCLDMYMKPKYLSCHHSFCEQCLVAYVESNNIRPGGDLVCPECRQVSKLPVKGVKGLPVDFNMNKLLEKLADIFLCDVHKKEEMKLFCSQCNVYICLVCHASKHNGHSTKDINEKYDEKKNECNDKKEIINRKKNSLEYNIQLAKSSKVDMQIQADDLEKLFGIEGNKFLENIIDELDRMKIVTKTRA